MGGKQMSYQSICISSGHGKKIRGASGSPIPPMVDEVDEARKIVNKLAEELINRGVDVRVFHDDVSTTQSENLDRIVDWHNAQKPHDLDVSIHLNAFDGSAHGTECLYVSQSALAGQVAAAVAAAGPFTNRGPKKRTDLAFLNGTSAPAILDEVFFCDNKGDCDTYHKRFNEICAAIADVLGGDVGVIEAPPPEATRPPVTPAPGEPLFYAKGKMSYFGGPDDTTGMTETEGLAFHYEITEQNQMLFLPINDGTGLARQLNPFVNYLAVRWDYSTTSKDMLANSGMRALVRSVATGREALAWPADWGPNENTGRVADLSPGLCEVLGIETDDIVEVIYPAPGEETA
jgi:N-acetylmuramoyl-L-alanine amidase